MAGAMGACFTRTSFPMRGVSIVVALFSSCLVVMSAGCDTFRLLGENPSDRSADPAASSARSRPGPKPSASPKAPTASAHSPPPHVPLDLGLRRKLKLAPLRGGSARLAFGKDRLGILVNDALVVRDNERFGEVVRLPIVAPQALTSLFDGSLFALGKEGRVRLLPQDKVAHASKALPLTVGARLLPDRRYPDRLWVLAGSGDALLAYDLGAVDTPYPVADVWVDLDGFDRRAFGSLRDGSFVYTTAAGLLQFYGPQKRTPIAGKLSDIFRLLPGSRSDTVWALTREGATLFRILAGALYPLTSVHFEAMPFETEAASEFLFALELLQPDDAPWRFILETFDVRGQRRLRTELSAEESLTEDWVAELIRDRELAVSSNPPLVAVGGPTHLSVWSAEDGKSRYDGP